jgi:hypothetical protein
MPENITNTLTTTPAAMRVVSETGYNSTVEGERVNNPDKDFIGAIDAAEVLSITFKLTGDAPAAVQIEGRSTEIGEYFHVSSHGSRFNGRDPIQPGETRTIHIDLREVRAVVRYVKFTAWLESAGSGDLEIVVAWR